MVHLLPYLTYSVYAGLFPPVALVGRPAPHGEAGQRLDPSTPEHEHQKHHRHPFQTEAADDTLLRRADRISVPAFRLDPPAAAAFYGIVAPRTRGAPTGTSQFLKRPNKIRLAWRGDQVARFKTRWSFIKWRSVANPATR
jgi:hypothetical protein